MSGTLIDSPAYTPNSVPSVLQTDAVEGQAAGASHGGIGNSNAGAQALANRTAFLFGRQNTNIANIGTLQGQVAAIEAELPTLVPFADMGNGSLGPTFAGLVVNGQTNFSAANVGSFQAFINQDGQPALQFFADVFVLGQNGIGLFLNGGNSQSSVKLDTGNNVTIPAACTAVTFNTSSDLRLKKDIGEIAPEEGVRFVLRLDPRTYVKDGAREAGFIAQEALREGFDHLVREEDCDRPEVREGDGGPAGKQLTIGYNQVLAYHQAALRKAFAKIEELERRLASLEGGVG
jgi:hypothetical protein